MIYFVQPIGGGPIKIGFSDDVETRVRQLETYFDTPMTLLGTMDGDREVEKETHARFSHLRIRRTEQFRPASDLLAFIGCPLIAGANPDAVESLPIRPGGPMVTIRGTEAWRTYLAELADFDRSTSISDMIDRAIVSYARSIGFKKNPPKR